MKKGTLLLSCLLAILFQSIHSQDGFATLGDGTTGGAGGSRVSVCTEDELTIALKDDIPRIVRVVCMISLENRVYVGSNKSILGATIDAGISGHGFNIKRKKNVIIRGLHFCCAIAPDDGLTIDESINVWIDHNEFYSDMEHDKDYYDGLIDVINGSDFITISWNQFHDHWKTNLVGNSDDLGYMDLGRLRITYHHNYFVNCYSRVPSLRFGTAHIYNNYYHNITGSGINSRMGAQVLVEGNFFRNTIRPITTSQDSREDGFAVYRNNDFGGSAIYITQVGTFSQPPYSYRMDRLSKVPYLVQRNSGPTILF